MTHDPYKNLPPDASQDRPKWPPLQRWPGGRIWARVIAFIVLLFVLLWFLIGFQAGG